MNEVEPPDPSIWEDVVGRCKNCGEVLRLNSLDDAVIDKLELGSMYEVAYDDLWKAVADWIYEEDKEKAEKNLREIWENGEISN